MTKPGGRATSIDFAISERLRAFRNDAHLTQTMLGTAVGVSFQQIQKYESGTNRISAGRLLELAHVLSVDISKFFEDLKPTSRKPNRPEGKRVAGHKAAMAPLRSEPPGMERDSRGHAIPMKERVPEDRAKAKRAKVAKGRHR